MNITDLSFANLDNFYQCFSTVMKEGYSEFPPKLQEYFLKVLYSKVNFYFWMERSLRKILILQQDQQTVGFLVGDHTYGGVGFVSWLGIDKAYRGQGLGKKLMQEYEKYALSKKAHLLELFTYQNVLPFYQKLGFTEIGRREQGYFGQKNIIMDKLIGKWDQKLLDTI